MISPQSAPPGTVVICVDADSTGKYMPPGATFISADMHGLTEGASYTVSDWYVLPLHNVRIVVLAEIVRPQIPGAIHVPGFDPRRFRLPITPESLKALSCESPDHLDKGAPERSRRRVRA